MLRLSTMKYWMTALAMAGLLAVNMNVTGTAFAGENRIWRNFSVPVPDNWKEGEVTAYQASWNFGDMQSQRYGFLGFYLSRQKPGEMPLEKGASMIPAGSRKLAGLPAAAYDITFPEPDKHYRLIALDQPDPDGGYIFAMAGVKGLSFETEWPQMEAVIDAVSWVEVPVSDPLVGSTASGSPSAPPATATGDSREPGGDSGPAGLQAGQGIVPPGWRIETWKNFSVAVPPDWQTVEESRSSGVSWGKVDKATKKGVMFGIVSERKPFDQEKPDPRMTITELGTTSVLGHPAKIMEMRGSPEPGIDVRAMILALDQPDPDGRYIGFVAGVTGQPWDDHWPTLEKAFVSLSGTLTTAEGGAEGPAAAPGAATGMPVAMKSEKVWEFVSLSVPKGWTRLGDADAVVWMSNMAEEPEASFMVMKGEKTAKTLAEMRIDETIPGYLGGVSASVHNGKVSYYETPAEVWVLENCLPDGSQVGVVLGGTDRKKHQGAFHGVLGNIRFDLPEGSGPCGKPRAEKSAPVPDAGNSGNIASAGAAKQTDPGQTSRSPASGASGRVSLRKGVADFVAARETPGPNGSADAVLRLEVTAPGKTIASLAMGPEGGPAMWDTLSGNSAWLMGAGRKNTLLNRPDGGLNVPLGQGPDILDLYVQDNNTIAAGRTPLVVTVSFSDASVLQLPVERTDS